MTWTNGITTALLAVCLTASAAAAAETIAPDALAGRWFVSGPGNNLRLDLARCGDKWCGVEVQADGKCGRIALRLTPGDPKETPAQFTGSFSRADATQPYAVGVSIIDARGKRVMSMYGNSGTRFIPFTRSYPLHMALTREGEAVCKADEKTS